MTIRNFETGEIIESSEQLAYALKRCGIKVCDTDAPDYIVFIREFLEYFYSGNYVEIDDEYECEFDEEYNAICERYDADFIEGKLDII